MKLPTKTIVLLTVGAIGVACGSNGAGDSGGSSQSGPGTGSATTSGGRGEGGAGDGGAGEGGLPGFGGDLGPGGPGSGGSTGEGGACATQTAEADLEPVYLAFAFDVSGSMGMGDDPWHDKSLKWDPVVAATKQFFSDPLSEGLNASLRFFPSEGDTDTKCDADTYTTPEVTMTPLPSPAFAAAIDAVTPETESDWRGGTPTLFVMQGTISYVEAQREATPGKYAIVLVTDGYPQGCGSRYNKISLVADEASSALSNNIPTYVIGVANPPIEGAPETVEDMDEVAVAGGTDHAYLIDTGNPAATSAAFKAAIDAIRGAAVSCTVDIPPAPDGRSFDAQKVRVTYTSGDGAPTALAYDQECAAANAWRYDSPENPSQIVLCDSTCATIQADPRAALGVDFTCEDVIMIPQ
ncbi:cell wall anchor domain-containing protein [Sorangium cellulosum]|uniref:Cell wall anchor domain-containing protein n=1 Tax=Sorangium cellulosum TaxID=56 RepID=A0A150TIK7_SORCE|nr:cell wall anchor domain-containing protein [Sorangium cellulosum]